MIQNDMTLQPYFSEERSVGEILENRLQELGMKQSDLSDLTSIAKPVICDIIKGTRSITAEMAILFESAVSLPAFYMMQVQAKSEIEKAANSQRVQDMVSSIYDWNTIKNHISLPTLKKLGILKGNIRDNVNSVLDMFNVNSSEEFIHMKEAESAKACYKLSARLHVDGSALFTWKYYCISKAKRTSLLNPFYKTDIDTLIKHTNAIFLENRETYKRIEDLYMNYGIKLLYIDKVGQVPVDGMSFWSDDNPTIVLTRRLKNIDNFAFALLHELGHIKLHLNQGDEALINFDTSERDFQEQQADTFAQDAFIARKDWDDFMKRVKNINPFAVHTWIEALAKEHHVNPQILLGRYMHDTGYYRLRRVFPVEVN